MSKQPMTREGYEKLVDDLKQMRGDQMKEVLSNLMDARDKGDINENTEYEVAKESFDTLQKKISSLNEKLNNSIIIDKSMVKTDSVQLLTTVKIQNLKTQSLHTYTIVPETESDTKECKISYMSPIGKGLIGKKVNECVKIVVPIGILEFKILEITI